MKGNRFSKRRGSSVIQTLIIIAVMGGIAITSIIRIHDLVIERANSTNEALLESQKIDVDYLVNQE